MKRVILKVGGSVLAKLPKNFYRTVVALKNANICDPIIVHGGGPEINQVLTKSHVESTFVEGLRVTTKEILHVAEMVMSGSINKQVVTNLKKAGGEAVGLSGVDGSLLEATPVDSSGNLGFVGRVSKVNESLLTLIMKQGMIPVISPIGMDDSGQHYNINGDMAASAVASALKGKLVFVSDIPGVMEIVDGNPIVHKKLAEQEIYKMIDSGVIYGGMIPKVRSAMNALSAGVEESMIINGLTPTDLKEYLEGNEVGTKITTGEVRHV
ncbi:acetylglutamate kinase [Oceanobacillus bengalensis]|uniref:Acetylglutamate kinase n=1 Tax=Oceanobacillus bengalensis TaxID=1435466 RepID=A0A494Z8J9_9BACI|nr:acetylglutamate kinase [Oceanobacillus bengalensis]RKQ18867.1 acetylglutamate kinase [Oceanobacillus bengalensis]